MLHCSLLLTDLLLYQAIVKTVSELSGPGICACCSFLGDSTAEGCAIELQNETHAFFFNMNRNYTTSEDLVILECFSAPQAGVFNVYVYEIQCGGVVGHRSWRLPVVVTEAEIASVSGSTNGRCTITISATDNCLLCMCIVRRVHVVIMLFLYRLCGDWSCCDVYSNPGCSGRTYSGHLYHEAEDIATE